MGIEVLQEELAFFAEIKEELLQTHRGQFALIKGRSLIGIYPTRLEAYTEGVKRYLAGPFLMKQILDVEPVEQILLFACSVSKRADLQPLLVN